MFHNRSQEIHRWQKAVARENAQFVVVYGRRRCGKSTLIRQLISSDDCYHLSVQGDEALQRSLFSQTLSLRFPGFELGTYLNWSVLFEALIRRGGERFNLVIDEFPYLVKTSPSLPSIIQHLLEDRSRLNFNLLLCGSSQHMMEDTVLSANAPLYGRADEIMQITPLAAGYLQDHLPGLAAEDLIREYAVWGGVPRYWELRSRYENLAEAIKDLLLTPTSLLKDEPRRLLLDDVRSLVQPISLLTLIAGGANRLSELGARSQKPAAELTRPLNRLIELGYVDKLTPYGTSLRSSRHTLYTVADHFMRFYHRFVLPRASQIELSKQEEVWQNIAQQFDQFTGQTWEMMCREAVGRGLAGEDFLPCQRWWGKTQSGQPVEIDLVTRSADGKKLLLGECKWSDVSKPETQHQRLRSLGPALPFYKGEEIETIVLARSGSETGPIEVLKALR